jgi:hypothetical protein
VENVRYRGIWEKNGSRCWRSREGRGACLFLESYSARRECDSDVMKAKPLPGKDRERRGSRRSSGHCLESGGECPRLCERGMRRVDDWALGGVSAKQTEDGLPLSVGERGIARRCRDLRVGASLRLDGSCLSRMVGARRCSTAWGQPNPPGEGGRGSASTAQSRRRVSPGDGCFLPMDGQLRMIEKG